MDRLSEAAALLTLLAGRKSGWASVADEIEQAGSAVSVFEDSGLHPVGQDSLFAPDALGGLNALAAARTSIARWDLEGIRLVTLLDAEYPPQLRTVHQRPPFLLYRGHLDSRDARGVAVVGTRKPSAGGLDRAGEIADGLARRGVTVISGLAAGVDTAAHRAALAAGGRTIAVIGTGLHKFYPAANRGLQEQIAADHLVLSQFWPDSPPTKTSFPMRNAVMSGYAAATVVIEAAWQSGARMQARLALEHGRPVFLHDSLIVHDWARDYERRGAVVVRSADDLHAVLDDKLEIADELVWS